MVRKYVKKPVTIEAIQYNGDNYLEICNFVGEGLDWTYGSRSLIIKTLEGDHYASIGDYIIKGIKGEFYPCKPDIFKETYDLAEENWGEPESNYRDGIPGVHYEEKL